jgi:Toastrack DUF4097
MMMKISNLLLVPVFCAISAVCFSDSMVGKTEDKSFQIGGHAAVVVKNPDGIVSVKSAEGNEVKVHAITKVWGASSESDAKKKAEDVHVEMTQSGDRVEVQVRYPHHFGLFHFGFHRDPQVTLEITTPAQSDLDASVSDGELSVDGITGKMDLNSADGTVTASHLSGNVRADVSDGKIAISHCSGDLNFSVSDGKLTVDDCSGRLKLHSSDGPVRLTGFQGDIEASIGDGSFYLDGVVHAMDVKVVDGNSEIRLAAGSTMQQDWTLRASDGSITLTLPKDFAANLDLATSDGHIKTEAPVILSGSVSANHISGKMNEGGHTLNIHTTDGNIELKN